jgi:geranylgeranyl diphosphate synthase type I
VTWDDSAGAAFRDRIQQTLDAWVDAQAIRLAPLGEDAARLLVAARESLTGGKRLRAAFCYWGFRSASTAELDPETETALLRAAASLEVLHASALVHDDFMDSSETRRGRPATHRAFADAHPIWGMTGDPEQYGAAAAILLGDLLLSWADEMLRTCGLPADRVSHALEVLDHTRSEVIVGQFLDVSIQARGRGSVEEAMKVLRYKSAKYSIERPIHLGATLAGASHETIEALSEFGLPLGEAFQLRDDVLGVFGDPEETGKPAGDDLVEGKRTVLIALTLERASTQQVERINSDLGRPLATAEVDLLRQIIEDTGAHSEIEHLIGDLTTRALTALDQAPINQAGRDALRSLADAAVRRTV